MPVFLLAIAEPTPKLFWIGVPFIAVGAAIRIWSSGYLTKLSNLITAGPFALCRNPLYIGSFLGCVGYLIICNNLIAWILTVPLFWAFHGGAVAYEEKLLREKFGEPFKQYCSKVPRFLPHIRSMAGEGEFSLGQVMYNREYTGLLGSVIITLFFAYIAYRLHDAPLELIVHHIQ